MRGALFSRAELDAPFAVRSGPLECGVFHAVVQGGCTVRIEGEDPVALDRGDVVYLPHGSDHTLADDPARPATLRRQIGVRPGPDGMDLLQVKGVGPRTTLLCGRVDSDESDFHPLVGLLPDVVHASAGDHQGVASQIPLLIQLLVAETQQGGMGSSATVARLTDLLVLHVVRSHVESMPDDATGWLRAMKDPMIAPVLALIHREPARSWTAAGLAREVGMSRSAFFRRFGNVVGEGPIEYLTRWRMHVASDRLRDGASVAAAARSVGYSTEASFSDAFLRITGSRPGAVRDDVVTLPGS